MSLDNIPNHQCYICQKTFSCVSTQRRHLRQIHRVETDDLSFVKKQLKCSICRNFICISSHEMNSHLTQTHDVTINIENFVFSSLEEFEKWKLELERNTNASFVKHAGAQKLDDGSKYYQYICSRSGKYSPKGTGKRMLKKQGSRKINAYCPAKISMKHFIEDGCILVEFNATHCGHHMESHHLSLTEMDRKAVAHNLARNVPFDCILDSVRNRATEPLGRLHLLTKKDLQNIKKRFIVNGDNQNKGCLTSIDAWVHEMTSKNEEDPVLLYKRSNFKDGNLDLGEQDFFLAFMTKKQVEILKKYGRKSVVIDSIQGTNLLGYEFTVVMVVDDKQEGVAVSFLYCSRKDELVYKIFFEAIKSRAGLLLPTVFMSCDNDIIYRAWVSIMGEVPLRLLCSWEVDSCWRKKLSLVNQKEKQVYVYKCIRMLLEETNLRRFEEMAPIVLKELAQDQDTAEFGKYLTENYMNRASEWAYCHRSETEIKRAGNSLEKFHHKLKTLHLKRSKPKSLECSIRALLQFVEHLKDSSGSGTNERNDHDAQPIVWVEQSSGTDSEMHHIAQCCDDPTCSLKCNDCNVCIHAFVNLCLDSSSAWTMCKHIQVIPGVVCDSVMTLQDSNDEAAESMVVDGKMDELTSIEVKFDLCKDQQKPKDINTEETTQHLQEQFNSLISRCHTEEHVRILEGILYTAFVAFSALDK